MGSKEKEEFVITVANQMGTRKLTRATAQLDGAQFNVLQTMVPFYGSDEAEVVKTIVILFLHQNAANVADVLDITGE